MHIDAAIGGNIQDLLCQELAESSHHDKIRLPFFQLLHKIRFFHLQWLEYRQALLQRKGLHRRLHHLLATAFRTVRLGHYGLNMILPSFY